MAKNKTVTTDADVYEFIESFANTDQKKADSLELIEWMKTIPIILMKLGQKP